MRHLSAFLLFVFIFLGQFAYSQELHTNSKKAIKLYKEGVKATHLRRFDDAKSLLDQAIAKDPDFIEAYMSMASIYSLYRNIEGELAYYEQALARDPGMKKLVPIYLHVARLQMQAGKYRDGLINVEKYLELNPPPATIEEAKALKANLAFAMEAVENPQPIKPVPLPRAVNAYQMQYFPVLTVDENTLIYTGRQSEMDFHDEDIYISVKKDGQWQRANSISTNINTELNEGTCTITADGRTLIFTMCSEPNGYGSCDLYITNKVGGEWSIPENLGGSINTANWESQPSLSADGRTLYFVSQRNGGYGGRDIYVSWRNDEGIWQEAINLGETINGPKDEVSPFIHVNNTTLYFSSNGRPGMGGFDLYFCNRTSDGWSEPVNIGFPMNDANNQTSLFITANGKNAYYSIDKMLNNGMRASAIFTVEVPESVRPPVKSNFLTGRVLNRITETPVKAAIELYDLEKEERAGLFSSDSLTGEYYTVLNAQTEYALYVNSPGYLFKTSYFKPDSTENTEGARLDILLDPIQADAVTTLNNIFFEFDSDQLVSKSIVELNRVISFLQSNPTIRVRIEGHTDSRGGDAYNKDLSTRRAKSVYEYLLSNDVQKSRLRYAGYGSSRPVAPNDTEEQRELNRRIEFRIISIGGKQ